MENLKTIETLAERVKDHYHYSRNIMEKIDWTVKLRDDIIYYMHLVSMLEKRIDIIEKKLK